MVVGSGRVQLVEVGGELDLASGDSLTARGYAALDRGARVLLLDLAEVSFCDARGLSALVRITNRADRAGCRYGLIAAWPQVVNLLRITGLGERLRVLTSVDDALAHLTPPAGLPLVTWRHRLVGISNGQDAVWAGRG